jgi:putative ABC transport system permease protein
VLSAISQAWASWRTAPGVALLAVVAFAVGIGSTTAIFTVINGVLLRPLPYPDSGRYVLLHGINTSAPGSLMAMSVPELQDYEGQTTTFDAFGWFRGDTYHLTAPGEPRFIRGTAVTPALARQLGSPVLGQWFADESGAVISSTLWQRLGGRRDVIGSALTLDERPYTVTGVMAPAFRLPVVSPGFGRGDAEVWIPLDPSPPDARRGSSQYFAYARRKPGVTLEQARADVKRVATIVAATDPQRYRTYTADATQLREVVAPGFRNTLWILLGGAALLLLIACANVATLLLARAVVRARDTAIRVALGASRRQLALRYLAEGALVSLAGAAAGVVLSAILVWQVLGAASPLLPHAGEIAIDWTVLGFSVAVAVATGLLAGMAPLWQAMRTAPNAVLTEGVRASAAAPARRLSKAFVIAEIALAFTLLSASTILIIHQRNLTRVSLGFEADGLFEFELTLPRRVMAAKAARPEQARLMALLQQTPGVTSATFAARLPPYSCAGGGTSIFLEGRPPDAVGQRVCLIQTTPDLLRTLRIPLRAGRWLDAADAERRDRLMVVINETAARAWLPGRSPLGTSGNLSERGGPPFEVVGVVGDVRNNGVKSAIEPELYLVSHVLQVNPMNVAVRSDLPADQAIARVRRALQQADPTLAMADARTIDAAVRDGLQLERVSSLVMTFFGLAALLMATLGVYGMVSYFVRQRTVELGTRMALGAVNRDLVALVLGGGLKLSMAGVAVGSVAVVGAVWLLVRFLDVANFGWLPFAVSTIAVGLVAGTAASVPAWRTTLLSPMVAMREQSPSVLRLARRGMQRAVRDLRQVVRTDESRTEISAADVLTAFVDAARSADSYVDALRNVLASVGHGLQVESAALFERRAASQPDYLPVVAAGALDAAALTIPADGFLITRLRTYSMPLAFVPGELTALANWAEAHRPDRLDEIRALATAGVGLAVPLRTRTEILGVLLLGERAHRAGFSAYEKQGLRAGAEQFALMLQNARLTDRVVEQETLRRDIALASDVQRRLLPDAPPHLEFAEFAAASVPARRIGGDYYDFVELRDRNIGIALADVSGKGVAAALIMSVVQASLRIISSEGDVALPRLVARMNQFVYRSTPASKYATFFYAQLDGERRRLRYVNAGHNAPYLLRAGEESSGAAVIEELSTGGTVVGMFPEIDYEEATVELRPGDVLLAFTDGVPEAHNPENEEFGEERLQRLLREVASLPADEISARISTEMKNWIRDAEQYDDLTFIVMKVR